MQLLFGIHGAIFFKSEGMAMRKGLLIGLAALGAVGIGVVYGFQAQIGTWLFQRAVEQNVGRNALADLPDGLHVGLCGTGSPMPNSDRAGPCNIVIAGDQLFVVDIGEGGNRNIGLMGIDAAEIDGVFLTHFHSDHIDGLGPLMLFHWTRGASAAPLPIYGPAGVEAVVAGFNAAYAINDGYRTAHHGEQVAPASGGGAEAQPFDLAGEVGVVFERDGLRITAFAVDHEPVAPALGYRFDYQGRSIVISGDTKRSPTLERAGAGADLLVHEALQPALVGEMAGALERRGIANLAMIMRDILDYHASPEDAAESATEAGVDMLVLSHLVPPLPNAFLYPAFLGDAENRFDGPIIVGEDGMFFSLPAGTGAIEQTQLM